MFGPPGHAYVYFTYGMHWLLNVVTEPAGSPCAVLIRGVEPVRGVEVMRANRGGRPDRALLCGPARLTQALRIDGELNGIDLVRGREAVIEVGEPLPDTDVIAAPRVGIDYADPEHRDAPWRLYVRGSMHVSRPR
jgi:DNA-3-methyladenine glycosylase